MSKKTLIISLIILVVAVIAVVRFWTPEDAWLCQNDQWVKHGSPRDPAPAEGCGPAAIPGNNLLGGDRDGHGCIGSAGYSWCASKQECIRVFEEDCLSAEALRQLFAEKYPKYAETVAVKMDQETPDHARGSVIFETGAPGGIFLAVKTGEGWQLVFDGNGSIDCDKIKQTYQFPAEMLTGFCD